MKISRFYTVLFFLTIMLISSCGKKDNLTVLKGPYLGQKPPGKTPELFAVGTITTEYHEHSSPEFSPDAKEVY